MLLRAGLHNWTLGQYPKTLVQLQRRYGCVTVGVFRAAPILAGSVPAVNGTSFLGVGICLLEVNDDSAYPRWC